jgi:hypothetical protein
MFSPGHSRYLPNFLWKFWISTRGSAAPARPPRVHVYDVYDNDLKELYEGLKGQPTIFRDLNFGLLDAESRYLLEEAEEAFSRLESQTELALNDILEYTVWSGRSDYAGSKSLPLSRISMETIRKYFIFLRFRNSSGYQKTVQSLEEAYQSQEDRSRVYHAFQHAIIQHRLRYILREFIRFFNYRSTVDLTTGMRQEELPLEIPTNPSLEMMETYCWRLCEAEVSFGVAMDEQEFVLSDRCYGNLDETLEEESLSSDLFFPICPTLALYILGTLEESPLSSITLRRPKHIAMLDVGLESAIDVHLRNAMILQTYPQYLFFQSLRTVALSVSSYEEFRSIPEHLDYSRLKQRCRQKFLQETVTKTLTVKGPVTLIDLTDDVEIIGDSAVAHGSFSDVWKGKWEDPIERRPRIVALKFLRQVMVKGVREKLLKRLQAEVLAWHRLCHKNVSQLFGIVQSPHSIAMVSQWCDNGTLSCYLKNIPEANRLKLLVQVASGISYLHQINIIHGDLKGGNILVDKNGDAIITDFGLSKVLEEMSDEMTVGTSFFAGSTRWMAPELIFALVEDDGGIPPITTSSDVYAFASVCLEIASGHLPYPNRSNDHAVTVDILRGIRPSRSRTCLLKLNTDGEEAFWALLDQCWSADPCTRPTMLHLLSFFEVLSASQRCPPP